MIWEWQKTAAAVEVLKDMFPGELRGVEAPVPLGSTPAPEPAPPLPAYTHPGVRRLGTIRPGEGYQAAKAPPLPPPPISEPAGAQFVRGLVRSTPLHAPPKAPPATPEEAHRSLIAQGLLSTAPPAIPTDDPAARNAVARQRSQEAAQAYHANEQARQQAAAERQRGQALRPTKWDRVQQEASQPVWSAGTGGLTPTNLSRGAQAFHEGVLAPTGRGLAKVPGAIKGEAVRSGGNFMKGWNWARGLRQ